jgi:hypothetical protein
VVRQAPFEHWYGAQLVETWTQLPFPSQSGTDRVLPEQTAVPHAVPDGWFVVTQLPLLQMLLPQAVLGGQVFPQAPQLLGSLLVSMQVPLHRVCPLGHVVGQVQGMSTHCPPRQIWEFEQTVPQLPQLSGSALVSRHTLPHRLIPGGQDGVGCGLAA